MRKPERARVQPQSRAERYAAGKALRETCPRDAARRLEGPRRPAGRGRDWSWRRRRGACPTCSPCATGAWSAPRSRSTGARPSRWRPTWRPRRSSGIRVQCCGDAHLCNFGGFATPERRIIFSINDLDETLPAPWEWDVKRLAASFVVACRDNGLSDAAARDVATTCVRTYRESMAEFSQMKTLELWYQALGADELVAGIKDPELRKRAIKRIQKERAKSVAEDIFPKLVEHKGEMPVIKDQLPTIFHAEGHPPGEVQQGRLDALAGYRDTLPPSYQSLLDRYELRDAAIKVVGVGSVGTACWVLLFMAGEGDPLFLQVKEARASVLEPYAGASVFPNHGQRVVNGYRLMQPASDMFLGWSQGPQGRHFFVRQLRDIKISVRVETFGRRRDGPLRHLVRKGPRPLPRPLRELRHAQRVHGQERRLRPGHRGLLGGLRRPEREGPRRPRPRGPQGQGEGGLRRGEVAGRSPPHSRRRLRSSARRSARARPPAGALDTTPPGVFECQGRGLAQHESGSNGAVMATAAKAFYGHITHNPRVLGGRACIDDTRIRVLDIVQLLHEGRRPEQMLDVFAVPLTLAQVHAALAYYYDHPQEVEEAYRDGERWEAEYERDRAEYLSRQQK